MRADATVSELCGRVPAATLMALGVSDHELALPSGMQGRLGPSVVALVAPDVLLLPSGMRGEVEPGRLRAA